jgi:choline dehydrogenase-like flavoprotein
MIFDADTHTKPGEELSAQLCIIGSGAAGIALAHKFIGNNKTVIVLESSRVSIPGGFSEERQLAFRHTEAPQVGGDHRFEDPTVQPLYEGTMVNQIGTDVNFLTRSRIRVYGGTTNCWGGWTTPLTAADFDRSDLDPRFKWPITLDDLRPFYSQAIRKYCSLGDWDVARYAEPSWWVGKTSTPVAPLALPAGSPLQTTVFTSINGGNGGYYLDFQLRWGPEIEKAGNVAIYRNANVRFLDSFAGGRSVARVRVTTVHDQKKGHDFFVKADQYILACGGIENPRLLLFSNNLGNASGYVGRCFMIHPLNTSAASFSPGTRQPSSAERAFYQFSATIASPGYPTTGVFATLTPTAVSLRRFGIGNFRSIIGFANFGPFSGNVNFNWEQMPNPGSTVTLDAKTDYLFGDPLVRVDWRLAPTDVQTIERGLDLTFGALSDLGYAAQPLRKDPRVTQPGDHHMGTTRMSAESVHGVVDANCRVHNVDNLYVSSSSVFSTGGFANPTLTIVAMALRLANHLGAPLGEGAGEERVQEYA